ncbi:hypothetical protein JXI42_13610 [bacterium]|nr:hypothetical protein [bacterium]
MKITAKSLFFMLLMSLMVFCACNEDSPTGPNGNNNVTDPNPPDYPAFTIAGF